MYKKLTLIAVVISSIILFSLVSALRSKALGIPDTPDAREIMAVMERAHILFRKPVETVDVNELAEVIVNTDDYRPSQENLEFISTILGSKAAQNAGFLAFLQAKHVQLQQGAKLLRAAVGKARTENRALTATEMQELVKRNHGMPLADLQDLNAPIPTPTLQYAWMQIEGDRATVRYDSGVADEEATLVKQDGHWYIASIKVIWAHF